MAKKKGKEDEVETTTSKDVLDIISKLRETYAAALPDVEVAGIVKRIILSSPKMNYILGGGHPEGRIIEFFGPESGGKTVLACYIGGCIQRRTDGGNKLVVFIDMEHTFDLRYANNVGLDTGSSDFLYVSPLHGEEAFTICQTLIESGKVGLIIWDSVAATGSATTMVDEYGKANFGKTAALFSEGLKKLNPYISRFKSSLILLNQVRDKIGGFNPNPNIKQESTNGGQAIKFYASWRARVSHLDDIYDGSELLGNRIRVKNVKSKIGIPKRTAELDLYYGTGFNPDAEYIDFLVSLGIVKKSGAWYSNEDWGFKGQGSASVLTFLIEHREIFEEAKQKVNESFEHHTTLDDLELPDPIAEIEADNTYMAGD